MSTPRTEAGKALLARIEGSHGYGSMPFSKRIAAIEDQAAATERARIAFEVGLLFSEWVAKQPDDEDILEVERAAVLAAIEGEPHA